MNINIKWQKIFGALFCMVRMDGYRGLNFEVERSFFYQTSAVKITVGPKSDDEVLVFRPTMSILNTLGVSSHFTVSLWRKKSLEKYFVSLAMNFRQLQEARL